MILWLDDDGLFKLITFRAALAGIFSFLVCLLIGPRIIAWLERHHVGENTEKEDSEKLDHLMKRKKNTLGGINLRMSGLCKRRKSCGFRLTIYSRTSG